VPDEIGRAPGSTLPVFLLFTVCALLGGCGGAPPSVYDGPEAPSPEALSADLLDTRAWIYSGHGCPPPASQCLRYAGPGTGRTLAFGPARQLRLDGERGFDGTVWELVGSRRASSSANDRSGVNDRRGGTTFLLSAAGPVVSTLHVYGGHRDTGGWASQQIEVEYLDGYEFSLREYLEESGQWQEGFGQWDLERFWLISWDGEERLLVGIQVSGCRRDRLPCHLVVEEITAHPPETWLPWLDAAAAGRGLLQR
jgi:hypothetical protein